VNSEVVPSVEQRPGAWLTDSFLAGYFTCFIVLLLAVARLLVSSLLLQAWIDGLVLCALCLFAWFLPDDDGDRRGLKLLSFFNFLYYGFVALLMVAMETWPDIFHPEIYRFLYSRVGGEPLAVLDRGILLAVMVQAIVLAVWATPQRQGRPRHLWQTVMEFVERPAILATTVVAFVVSSAAPQIVPLSIAHFLYLWGVLLSGILALRMVRWMRGLSEIGSWLWIIGLMAGVALFTGWKGPVIELVILAIIVVVAERGRLPRRLILVSALALVLFMPWAVAYRGILWHTDQGGGLDARLRSAQLASRETASMSIIDRTVSTVGFVAFRVGGQRIDELAEISAEPVRMHGSTIWPFIASPIPRFLWPSKPSLSPQLNKIAVVLKQDAGAASASTDSLATSMVWTQYTDLYLNFGVIGLAIGVLLIAGFLRWLNSSLLRDEVRTPETVGAFVILFTPFWHENTIGMVFQFVIQALLIFWGLSWLRGRSASPPRRASS
jgi:hypothetical protein